ncbi:trypsin inhibitor A-like, partial [Trifolium medium]|nr:trypsin inhibitor A-like [Trifolium medium]
ANSGGIRLGHTRNKTCPLDVIRDPNSIGEPIFFSPPGDLDFIPTLTDLTIDILNHGPCIQYSRIWKTSLVGSGFSGLFFVSTGGRPGDLDSKFKIVRLEGDIYSFKYCPSVPGVICDPVGTFVDTDGTKVLAIGKGIDEPYYVRFQRKLPLFLSRSIKI